MAFKLKDLMIDVLPGAKAAPQLAGPVTQCPVPSGNVQVAAAMVCPLPSVHTTYCPFPSAHPHCLAPSVLAQGACPMISATQPGAAMLQAQACPMISGMTQSITCADVPAGQQTDATQLANLATLKQQLQQHLDLVTQHEAAVHAAAKPQTVEEAQDLHQKMTDAMGELQAHIDDLKKKQTT